MKRVICLLFLAVFSISLASAQTGSIDLNTSRDGAREKTNSVLEKNIEIPEGLQVLSKFLFGLGDGEEVDLSTIVILFTLWLMMFFIFARIFLFLSFIDNKFVNWLIAFVCVSLLGTIGAIREASLFLFDFFFFVSLFEKYKILSLVFSVLIVLLTSYFALKLIKKLEDDSRLMEKRHIGIKTGASSAVIRRKVGIS